MKNYLLGLLLVSATCMNAQVTIANFDDGVNPLTCADDGGAVASFEIVDNPEMDGINNSPKAFKLINSNGGEWWGGLRMALPATLPVNDESRYLHIMMKFKNVGLQNFHFAVYSSTAEVWSALVNGGDIWFDYVIDLYNVEGAKFAELSALRYQSRPDNPSNQGNEVYIDEIILNNDAAPRAGVIDFAATIANFEDGSFNSLVLSDDGGGVSSFEVADNPEFQGVNNTSKALKVVVSSTPGDYWPGLRVVLPKVVLINENTRYLHVLAHATTNDQSCEYNIYADGEHYMGEILTKGSWEDHVIDLNGCMGKVVTGFRYATRIDRHTNVGQTRYLDEIAFSASSIPRTDVVSVNEIDASRVKVFNVENGISIQGGEGAFIIYNVNGAFVQQGVTEGYTQVSLPQGFYIVKLGALCYKIVVK